MAYLLRLCEACWRQGIGYSTAVVEMMWRAEYDDEGMVGGRELSFLTSNAFQSSYVGFVLFVMFCCLAVGLLTYAMTDCMATSVRFIDSNQAPPDPMFHQA